MTASINGDVGGVLTQKVAIVTDSIACLTRELVEQYRIEIIPLNFYAGGKLYKDWVDVTPTEAYELFLKDPESFKTSSASPEDCLNAYRNASKRARDIFCVTVSLKLSTVYNVAKGAIELAKSELPQTSIEVLDSQTATAAEGFIALAAARAAAEGKDLTEVVSTAKEVRDKVSVIVLLDTMRHVYRSGRIPKVAAQVGSVFNIRPIFTVSGAVHFTGAVRNREHGINRILQMMRDKAGQSPVHVAVLHAYALDEAERLKERVSAEFNCAELWLSEFSPLMGYACGTGTVGLAFYPED
ncbi:MAG: DegV family protein [Dehalococcoidales bacterium]